MKFSLFPSLVAFGLFVGCGEDAQDKSVLPAEKAKVATEIVEKDGMVLIPGQTYRRGNEYNPGNDKMYREEAPPHMVTVSGFWIDKHEVTNAQFKEFVDATGYVTFTKKPKQGGVSQCASRTIGSRRHHIQSPIR